MTRPYRNPLPQIRCQEQRVRCTGFSEQNVGNDLVIAGITLTGVQQDGRVGGRRAYCPLPRWIGTVIQMSCCAGKVLQGCAAASAITGNDPATRTAAASDAFERFS
jgi:hypothetical protein